MFNGPVVLNGLYRGARSFFFNVYLFQCEDIWCGIFFDQFDCSSHLSDVVIEEDTISFVRHNKRTGDDCKFDLALMGGEWAGTYQVIPSGNLEKIRVEINPCSQSFLLEAMNSAPS